MSYFHGYFNLRKERTLRRFLCTVQPEIFRFAELDDDGEAGVVRRGAFVYDSPFRFAEEWGGKNLSRIDDRLFRGECVDRASNRHSPYSNRDAVLRPSENEAHNRSVCWYIQAVV